MNLFGRLVWRELLPFGAEVQCDLATPLDDAERERFRQLLFEHQLLVFRGQRLTHPQQIAVMEYIAPVLRLPEFVHFISSDPRRGALGTQALPFHSDLSFAEKFRLAISLHGVELTDGASSTRFVSARDAAGRLPSVLRREIENLRALHVMPWRAAGTLHRDAYDKSHLHQSPPEWVPRHAHPVLQTHPVTGQPILYVNELLTAHMEDMPRQEGSVLLTKLLDCLYAGENQFEHVWHRGDLLIWDNVAVQHARSDISDCGPRTLQKVQLGDVTLEQQWPQYDAEAMQRMLAANPDSGL